VDGETHYLFSGIAAVRLLPDGRVAVVDRGSATIRLFGEDGVFEREIGRRGQGPGELRYPNALWSVGADTLVVYDSGNQRLSRFRTSGELLESTTFRGDVRLPESYLGRLSSGPHVISWLGGGGELGAVPVADSVFYGTFDADSLRSILASSSGMHRIKVTVREPGYTGPIPFSPSALRAMIGDTIFHSDGLGGLVHAVGPDGSELRSFRVPVEAWAVEEAEAAAEGAIDPERAERFPMLVRWPGTDTIPSLSDMLVDSESLLWVKQYQPATDSHAVGRLRTGGTWLAVETDGTIAGRVELPAGFRPYEITRDRVAGVMRDELDVERVMVFALNRG